MENPQANSAPAPLRWPSLARALLGVAILGAAYLALVSISHGPVAGCEAGSGCDKVLQSRWAYWLGLPVSVPALLVYLALLGSINLMQNKQSSPDDERGAWAAIIGLSVIVAGAALWFIGLQVFVIKAFCKFCMATHACGLLAAALCLTKTPLAQDPATPMWATGSGKRGVPRSGFLSLVLIGLAGVGVLAGGQVLVQKERNVVKVFPAPGTNAASRRPLASATGTNLSGPGPATAAQTNLPPSPNARLIAPRLLSLYDGQFLIRLDDVPMIGSPDAPLVMVDLFDYTCLHCRLIHPMLLEAERRASNQLGIACLPMPMSTNCNPFMSKKLPSMTNACEYARLSLAVFKATPNLYRQFDDWLFSPGEVKPLETVAQYATNLVGGEKLGIALADPWIEQQLLTSSQLHMTNSQLTTRSAMPQLILGRVISVGALNSPRHLQILLERYLGLKPDSTSTP